VGGKVLFKSRILIKMPKGLTLWDQALIAGKLIVQNMDGTMTRPKISAVVDEPEEECGETADYERVCYAIEP